MTHHDKAPAAATAPETTPTPTMEALPPSELRQIIQLLIEQRPDPLMDHLARLGVGPERKAEFLSALQPGKARRYRRVPLRGDEGATAIGVIAEDPRSPTGIIVRMESYRFPDGMTTHVKDGGRVPDGLQIGKNAEAEATISLCKLQGTMDLPPSALTFHYLEWKLETFYRRDWRMWIGKPLRAGYCDPAGQGLATPWTDTDVQAS